MAISSHIRSLQMHKPGLTAMHYAFMQYLPSSPQTTVVPAQTLCIMGIMHYVAMHYEVFDCSRNPPEAADPLSMFCIKHPDSCFLPVSGFVIPTIT